MVCIYNPSTEQLNALDRYAHVLGSEDAAYFVLSQNNGFPLDKTPNGEDSDLYVDMIAHFGSEDEAIRNKAMLYTNRFLEANGDWTVGDLNDPSMYDSKQEPKLSFITGAMTDDLQSIMNHQFLLDADFPLVETDNLAAISPTDDLSDYAVDQLLRKSWDQYVDRSRVEFKMNNPAATEDEINKNDVNASRQWYSRKINAIVNEQIKALATAFGLVYVQKPNGQIEFQSKNRDVKGLLELRVKFLNNIVSDPLEDELRKEILGAEPLSSINKLSDPNSKDYIHDAVIRHRKNDRLIAASAAISVSLNNATATTINKTLAYHYITMFLDSPLIQAGLEAVRDDASRSQLYLVNKLVDIITTPSIAGVQSMSYVGQAFKNGVTPEVIQKFWDEYDDLLDQVINKGVKSEEAKKKILSVVAAAFQLNDRFNIYQRPPVSGVTAMFDAYADWYSTKYKPWGEQNNKELSTLETFFNALDKYYENKIKRQERDRFVDKIASARTQRALYELQQSDKISPAAQEKIIEDLLNLAYEEIRDADESIRNLDMSYAAIDDKMGKLGSEYSDVISFYNYIINTRMPDFFSSTNNLFPSMLLKYTAVKKMLSDLDYLYKAKLENITERYVDAYIDKYMDKYQVTDEMIRNAKLNAHLELKNNAVYGDLKNYDVWMMMTSVDNSSIVRQAANAIQRLNVNRDQITLAAGKELQRSLQKAKKAILKSPILWGAYAFGPKNFQMLFQERYDDGTPSGMFVRRLHYGNFFKMRAQENAKIIRDIERDIQNETGNIHFKLDLDQYGNPIFPEGDMWDKYYREYAHRINAFECEYGHKRYLQEYYDIRIDNLSRNTIATQDDLQNRIDTILRPVTEDNIPYLHKLSIEELRTLQDLYKQQDDLANEYDRLGNKKTGEGLKMAREIRNFRNIIKDRVLYETDEEKFQKAIDSIEDPAEQAEFIKAVTERDINPKFWEIYKIRKKEYRDLFPDTFKDLWDDIDRLNQERMDIVNTVKSKRAVQPNLRQIQDAAWDRIKELDDLIEAAYTPIIEYKRSMGIKTPSPFKELARLEDVQDIYDPSKTMYDALMQEARDKDAEESLAMGYTIHTNELEAMDKYSRVSVGPSGARQVPLSVFSYMLPSVFPDYIKSRFGIDDTFEYVTDVPVRSFSKIVDPSTGKYVASPLIDPEYDPDEGSYVQPKEINPIYEMLANPDETPPEVFDLYNKCLQAKANADVMIPQLNMQQHFRLPQMRAQDLAIMSRLVLRGPLATLEECFTNKFIANETDDDIIDDFTTLPDGTRVNNVPRKFLDNLRDMTLLTSDVVGSLVMYTHMAANYYFKQYNAPIFQALLQQVGQDSSIQTIDGSSHLILGKTTNQYAKLKNVLDYLLYDQPQLWGERGNDKMSKKQKTALKTAKTTGKIGTLAALSRNTLSQTTGFLDALGKLNSFAFSGDAFNEKDLAFAKATIALYLPRMFSATGEVLPSNLIAAIMQKNGLSTSVQHKYMGGYKSQTRRVVGLEREGMGGFRVSDYIINAAVALSLYNNYRFIDNEFLPERSFKNKLKRQGWSSRDIRKAYNKATTLLDAYGYSWNPFDFSNQDFIMESRFAEKLGKNGVRKIEQDISIACRTWAPKFNGAVADEDKAVIQQNILAGFTVAMRSYLINEFQTRYANGRDFQDPTISRKMVDALKVRRNALIKVYKSTYTTHNKESKLQKLLSRKSEIESELLKLQTSGDVQGLNWTLIRDMAGFEFFEAGVGAYIGSMFDNTGTSITGTVIGAVVGAIHGAIIGTGGKIKGNSKVNTFKSKIESLEMKLRKVNEQINALNLSDSKDLILMEIMQLNERIAEMLNKLNENQGFYDYARNIYTNGSNRLAGKLLSNAMKNAYWYINNVMPRPFKTLKATYRPKITENQVRGLKRVAYDLLRAITWWLIATFMLSWMRYDDGRGFLRGSFNKQTTEIMHKMDEGLRWALTPIMESESWKNFWENAHESSTEGFISHIPYVDKVVELKSDAMLGYTKTVSRKTGKTKRIKKDAVQRQIDFAKAFCAAQSLKVYTEGVTPYDPNTINDLTNAVSANLNVMSKEAEAGVNMVAQAQEGTLDAYMQGGPYAAYFNREEYGAAHSWQKPFGYPSAFEQSTEIGLINRTNYLGNIGFNSITIPKKEPAKTTTKKKSKHKKNKKTFGS